MKFENYIDLLLKENNEKYRLSVYLVDKYGDEVCVIEPKYYYIPFVLNSEIMQIYKCDGFLHVEVYRELSMEVIKDGK